MKSFVVLCVVMIQVLAAVPKESLTDMKLTSPLPSALFKAKQVEPTTTAGNVIATTAPPPATTTQPQQTPTATPQPADDGNSSGGGSESGAIMFLKIVGIIAGVCLVLAVVAMVVHRRNHRR